MGILEIFLRYVLPFLSAYVISIVLNKFLSKEMLRGKLHLIFLKGIIIAVVWVSATLTALHSIPAFSRTWETAVASSGIAAVVLGLAAQSTLANVFAGISLSASRSRPFDIGDRVKIDSYDPGYVENITLRHTVIKTYQNEILYIPNSTVGAAVIVNYSQEQSFSSPIEVSVAYGTDIDRASEIMADVIENSENHYGERPVVLVRSLDESGITLRALVETRDFKDNPKACSDCRTEVVKRFDEAGIEIPYNKLVVISSK